MKAQFHLQLSCNEFTTFWSQNTWSSSIPIYLRARIKASDDVCCKGLEFDCVSLRCRFSAPKTQGIEKNGAPEIMCA
jgi:hypothetical protein